MFIYNITTQVTWKIHEGWLEWMKAMHIPDVMASGCFIEYRLLRLVEVDETDGPTYAAQFMAESKVLYNRYISEYAPGLRSKSFDKWGDQFISFRSVMQQVLPDKL